MYLNTVLPLELHIKYLKHITIFISPALHIQQLSINILYKIQVCFPRYFRQCLSPFPHPTSLPVPIFTPFPPYSIRSSCQVESSDHVSCSRIIYRFTHPVEFPWRVPLGFWHCRGLLCHECRVLGIATLHNSLRVEQITLLLKTSHLSFHVIKNRNAKREFMKFSQKWKFKEGIFESSSLYPMKRKGS